MPSLIDYHKDRPIRLGVDMDGTLFANDRIWKSYFDSRRELHAHPGELEIPPPDWHYYKNFCARCMKDCTDEPEILLEAEPMPEMVEALTMMVNRGWVELTLVTHRLPSLEPAIHELLALHNIEHLFREFVVGFEPKRGVCVERRLDALVDDGPHNIQGLVGSGVFPIVMDTPYNREIDFPYDPWQKSHIRVTSWGQIAQFIRLWRAGGIHGMAQLVA